MREHIRNMGALTGVALAVMIAAWTVSALADSFSDGGGVPRLVPFRARLEQAGAPVTSTVTASFSIYDANTGGTRLWGPEVHTITPVDGELSVMLGSMMRLSPSVLQSGDAYVEVTIGTTVLAGRQRLGSVPYALRANASAFEVPVGGVILWWGSPAQLPFGFEVCDGAMPSTAGATLTGAKPDLRDRFVKGLATGETLGRTGGQNSEPSHTHSGTTGASNAAGPSQGARDGANNFTVLPEQGHTHNFGTSVNSNAGASYANAPAFLSMYYVIRVL